MWRLSSAIGALGTRSRTGALCHFDRLRFFSSSTSLHPHFSLHLLDARHVGANNKAWYGTCCGPGAFHSRGSVAHRHPARRPIASDTGKYKHLALAREPARAAAQQPAHSTDHATPRWTAATTPHPTRQARRVRLVRQGWGGQIHNLVEPRGGTRADATAWHASAEGGTAGPGHLWAERAQAHGARGDGRGGAHARRCADPTHQPRCEVHVDGVPPRQYTRRRGWGGGAGGGMEGDDGDESDAAVVVRCGLATGSSRGADRWGGGWVGCVGDRHAAGDGRCGAVARAAGGGGCGAGGDDAAGSGAARRAQGRGHVSQDQRARRRARAQHEPLYQPRHRSRVRAVW
ncbi:hypothetical protein L1887_43295 [Cichorium endivia]|nr:hypothetical protein L1887_43295 [Cichorium endivia]